MPLSQLTVQDSDSTEQSKPNEYSKNSTIMITDCNEVSQMPQHNNFK